MDIQVRIDPGVNYRQWRALLGLSGWGTEEHYTDAILESMIKECSYFVVAQDTNTLVGYARAFTDHVMVTWIAEILIHPEYRRQGIGTRIMNELLRVTGHTSIYAEALAGNEGFFASFDIKPKTTLVACSRKPLAS